MRADPKPRTGRFYGALIINLLATDGTWLEGEEFAYPNGGLKRRAWVICPDGRRRVVWCGIPDTFFTIPARALIEGRYTRGWVGSDETGFKFHGYGTSR